VGLTFELDGLHAVLEPRRDSWLVSYPSSNVEAEIEWLDPT
jgi:hypothetical protein